MERLRNLLGFLITRSPRPLTRTELVKLVYLFEYEQTQAYGSQYTEVEFERNKFGPYSAALVKEAVDLAQEGLVLQSWHIFSWGDVKYEYRTVDRQRAIERYQLPEPQSSHALALINRTSGLNLRQLKEMAYSTPPMANLVDEEARLGTGRMNRRIDLSIAKAPKVFTKEQLAAAKARLDQIRDRGSDEEYALRIKKEFERSAGLRRRATKCLLHN